MKPNYCYHTHTFRCGHASGKDEEYVIHAINNGIKTLGFSDHIMLKDVDQSQIRGSYSMLDGYVKSINELKEKYKGQIEILLGFEAEYSDRYLPYYKYLKEEKGFDYFILGQHFNFDNTVTPKHIYEEDDPALGVESYVNHVIKAMKSGLFLYVAHPDTYVVKFEQFDDICVKAAHQICKAAEELHMPLELNAHAYLCWKKGSKLVYPHEEFWKIASQYNIEVVIGYDAHSPMEFDENIDFIYNIIKKYNLKQKSFNH